jgi:hypothetical protein
LFNTSNTFDTERERISVQDSESARQKDENETSKMSKLMALALKSKVVKIMKKNQKKNLLIRADSIVSSGVFEGLDELQKKNLE